MSLKVQFRIEHYGFVFARSLCLLGFVVLASCCFAQDDFSSSVDRPSFSDGPYIVPKGHWQVEGGWTATKPKGSRSETWGEMEIRFNVNPRTEFRVLNVTYETGPFGAKGLQDPAIGIKCQTQKAVQGKKPTLTAIFTTTVPAGGRDFRTDRWQPTAKLATDFPVNDNLSIGGNLLVSDLGPSNARFTQYGWSAYGSVGIGPTSGWFVEGFGLLPEASHGPDALFIQTGLTHLLNKVTQADIRIGEGLNRDRDGWWIGAGIAHRF